jgi:hypothetical protein
LIVMPRIINHHMSSKNIAYQVNGIYMHMGIHLYMFHNQLMDMVTYLESTIEENYCLHICIHKVYQDFAIQGQRCLAVPTMLLLVHTQFYLALLSCYESHKTPNFVLHSPTLLKRLLIHNQIYKYIYIYISYGTFMHLNTTSDKYTYLTRWLLQQLLLPVLLTQLLLPQQ